MRSFTKLVLSFCMLFAFNARAANQGDIREIQDTRPIIWPWSLATDVPWWHIEGTWKVEKQGFVSYFTIELSKRQVYYDSTERPHLLRIHQLNGYSCNVMAYGTGIETDTGIRALMIDKLGFTYDLGLTVFKSRDTVGNLGVLHPVDSVMVISISALEKPELTHHLQMTKVSDGIGTENCSYLIKN